MGYASAAIIIAGILLVALSEHEGNSVANTFFTSSAWHKSFPQMIRAFWTNIWVALLAQVLVLAFGLLLAVMRMLPGRAGAPLRLIALVYCDIFRAIPAIVTILLIGMGLGLAVVRAIVTEHGGTITATSAGGAEFIVSFPAHAAKMS